MKKIVALLLIFNFAINTNSFATTATAIASGNWNAASGVWTGGSGTGGVPGSGDNVLINAGVTVTVNSSVASFSGTITFASSTAIIDILNGGTLTNTAGTPFTSTIAGQFLIENGGTFISSGTTVPSTFSAGSLIEVKTGGEFQVIVTGGFPWASISSTQMKWDNGSRFNYNKSGSSVQIPAATYFPNAAAGTSPIFRITAISSNSNTNAVIIDGVLDINGALSTGMSNSAITARDGITGSGSVTTGTSLWQITGTTAVLGVTGSITLGAGNLKIADGATCTMSASTAINSGTFTVGGGTSGVFNFSTFVLSGSTAFATAAGSTLGIGSPLGIVTARTTGNIQTTGTAPAYNSTTTFVYNGTANQATGTGLPATIGALTINNTGTAPTNIVTLSQATTIQANPASGTLTLTKGIFKLTGITLSFNTNSSSTGCFILNNSNGSSDFAHSGDGSGDADADGGTVSVSCPSGQKFTVDGTGSSTTAVTTFSTLTYPSGSALYLNIVKNSSLQITGTLSYNTNSVTWGTYSPMYGPTSTLSIGYNGNAFTPGSGKDWLPNVTHTLGTPGYPNNVTISNTNGNPSVAPAGDWSINGVLTLLNSASAVKLDLSANNATFNCGGVVIGSNSGNTLTAPTAQDMVVNAIAANSATTNNGNWLNSGGVFTNSSRTVTFAGPAAQSITPGGSSFYKLSITNTSNIVTLATATTVSNTTTVAANAILATSGTLTATGGATINGTFQINQGGYATGTFAYAATGSTLAYNLTNASGTYYGPVTTSHSYWPTTLPPFNVSITNSISGGGVDIGSTTHTIAGTFTLAAKIINNCNLTFSGPITLGTNYTWGSSCGTFSYPSSSCTTTNATNILTYSSGGTVTRGPEWTSSLTPTNVVLTGNTTMNFPTAGNGSICGNLTINSGSALYADYSGGSAQLTVGGSLTVNGTGAMSLGTASGDLLIGGNLNVSTSATFNFHGRAVNFDGSGTQVLTAIGGGTIDFTGTGTGNAPAYFLVNNNGGSVQLNNTVGSQTNVTVSNTNTNGFQIINSGSLDLNGQTLTYSGSGGSLEVNGSRSITSTVAGGNFTFTGSKTVVNSGSGTLAFGSNVTVNLNSGGVVDFGSGLTTINGTLSINSTSSCYVNNNPPTYGTNSTLTYNSGGAYGRGTEWNNTTSPGYPYNVTLANSTTVDLGANSGTGTARAIAGTLTIGSLSTLTMATSAMTAGLTIGKDVANSGNLTLSGSAGGELTVKGSFTQSGTFTPNGRYVYLSGSSGTAQTISGTLNGSGSTNNFYNLYVSNSSGGVTIGSAVSVTNQLTLNNGIVATSTPTNLITVTATGNGAITGYSTASYINGPLAWALPASLSASANVYTFPVGNTTYLPISFNTLTTGGTGPVIQEQAFSSAPTGTADGITVSSLSTTEYWQHTLVSGNFTSGSITLNRQSGVGSPAVNTVALSTTNGATSYSSIGGTESGGGPISIGYSGASVTSTTPQYFAMATALVVSPPTITVSGGVVASSPGSGTSGYVGNTITINGTNLNAVTIVKVGGSSGTAVTILSHSGTTALTFAAINLSGQIYVQSTGGNATSTETYTNLGYISTQAGDWNTLSGTYTTWLGGALPVAGSTVTIAHAVTVNTTVAFAPNVLTINSLNSLTFGGGTLMVNNTINNSGTITLTTGTLTTGASSALNNSGSIAFTSGALTTGSSSTLTNSSTIDMTSGGTINIGASGALANGSSTFTRGTGTVNFVGAGTVTGTITFKNVTINTGAVDFGTASTIDGIFLINSGFVSGGSTHSPFYTSNSTLKYAVSYGRFDEWNNTTPAGRGYPYNVEVNGSSTVLDIGARPADVNTAWELGGNLTIDAGATVTLNASGNVMNQPLVVKGTLNLSGILTLSGNSGGDIKVGGNWAFTAGGTFNTNGPNGRAVFFNGSAQQTISRSAAGTLNFDYILNDNTSGGIILSTGTNLNINATSGNGLKMDNLGGNTFDINGNTVTLANGSNINIAGGTQNITSTATGGIIQDVTSGGNNVNGSGTLTFGSNVTVSLVSNFDFGSSVSTINGTLLLNGGYTVTNSPAYGTGSLLKYYSGGTPGRGTEWLANTTSGYGYPYNVQIGFATTLELKNGNDNYYQIGGNLVVDQNSTFNMEGLTVGGTGANAGIALRVSGDVRNDGTINLYTGTTYSTKRLACTNYTNGYDSYAYSSGSIPAVTNLSGGGGSGVGGDLEVTGNLTDNATFNSNQRAVFFTGTGNQTISGVASGTFNVDYIVSNKASGTIKLLENLLTGGPNGGNALTLTSTTDIIDLNGFTFTLGTAGVNSIITGSGYIRGSSSSSLIINGTGAFGTVNFDPSNNGVTNVLSGLTLARTSTGSMDLGSAVTVGTLTLSNGNLNLGNNNLTLNQANIVGGTPSSSNHIVTNGSGAVIVAYPSGSASYIFPLGADATHYEPVTINKTGTTATQTYTTNIAAISGYPNANVLNYAWNISTGGGTQATTLSFQWPTGDAGGTLASNPTGGGVYEAATNNSTGWGAATSGGSTAGATPEVTIITGVTSFSNTYWTIAALPPTFNVTPSSLTFGTTNIGSTSASQSFTLSGVNLSGYPGSITINAPTNYLVSTTSSTTGFGASATLSYSSTTLSPGSPNVWVEFSPTAVGTLTGNITFSGGGVSTPPTVGLTGTGAAIYYNVASTDVTNTANWGTNTDGSGTTPINFTNANQTFIISNTGATMSTGWTVSGSGSSITVGNGTNTVTFVQTQAITGAVAVQNAATLQINTATVPTFGTLSSGSTVNYAGTSQAITATNYSNLSLSGATTPTFPAGTVGISGTFTTGTITSASAGTISFNGSGVQSVPAFTYKTLSIDNTNATAASTSGNITVNTALTVNQNFTVSTSNTLSFASSATITGAKTITVNGTFDDQTSNAAFTANAGGMTVNGILKFSGLASGSNTQISLTNVTIASGISGGTLSIASGMPRIPNTNAGNVIYSGAGAGNSILNTGAVTIGGSFTILSSGTGSINNGSGGTARSLAITGDLTVSGGEYDVAGSGATAAFSVSANNVYVSGIGLLYASATNSSGGTGAINIAGNLSHTAGSFGNNATGAASGTITFNGGSAQTIATTGFSNAPAVVINNSAASTISLTTDLNAIGNLTLTKGILTVGAHTLTLAGTITRTANGIDASNSSATVVMGGTSSQTIPASTFTGNVNNLTISNSAGVILQQAITIPGVLNLTSGVFNTNSATPSITNTATTGITAGSAFSVTNMINGPVTWSLPSSLGTGSTYIFPIGNTAYLPMSVVNPLTGTGAVTLTAKAVNASSGGSVSGLGISSLSTTEYWSLASTGNFTSSSVSLSRQIAIGSFVTIAQSTTLAGTYTNDGGTVSGNSIINSNSSSGAAQFFAFAIGPIAPTVTTTAATSVTTTSAQLNATVNPNGASTTPSFDYGTTTGYTSGNVAGTPSPITATQAVNSGTNVTGLTSNTTYHFRGDAMNSVNTTNGSDLTFVTVPNAPTAVTAGTPTTSGTTAGFTVSWTAPNPATTGSSYTYTVNVSTSPSFTSPVTQTGIAFGTTSAVFTGLTQATVYYYEVATVSTLSGTQSSAQDVGASSFTTAYTVGTTCSSGGGNIGTPAVIIDANSAPSGASDPQWTNAPTNLMNVNAVNTNGTALTGSTWQAMFDATNLYVLITAKDQTPNSSCGQGSNAYQWDGVEVYVDGQNGKQGSMQVAGKQATQWAFNYGCTGTANITGVNDSVIGVTYAISSNPGGSTGSYTSQITIPWAKVLNAPTVANLPIIGFNASYNDNQNGTNRGQQEVWFDSTGGGGNFYNQPKYWGNAKLSVCAPPTLTTQAATGITNSSATFGATVTAINGGTLVAGGAGVAYVAAPTTVTSQNATGGITPTLNTPFTQTITGLSPQTQYNYVGYATRTDFSTNVTGNSPQSSFFTLSNPVTAQGGFGATTGITCNQATLNWTTATFPGSSGATANGYILIRSTGTATSAGVTNGVAPASLVLTGGTLVTTITSGSTLTYTNTGLSTGNTYNYLLIPFTWDGTNAGTYNYLTTSAPSTSVTPVTTGTPTSSTPSAVCFGTSATITGTGGSNATSWTFWTATSGGSQVTTSTTPPGTVSASVLTTPTTLAGGSYIYYVQGENGTGCASASREAVTVTVTAAPSATISYSGTPFCSSTGTQTVSFSGTSGGTYSSTSGLTINGSTGAITPSTSTPGTYTVTYTVAAAGGCSIYTTTTSVTVTAAPSATISYSGTPFCSTAGTQTVTFSGTTGGTYSSTSGLTINGSTGTITPSTSTVGSYTVTYTVAAAGGCSVYTTTTSVTINAGPSATISYSGTPFCSSAGTQSVTQTGTSGGTYSSTSGLTIDGSTGDITPSTSTAGTYTVTYTIAAAGGCTTYTTTTSVTITANPSGTTISYTSTPCNSTGTNSVTITGVSGGTFSSTTGLTINGTSGDIDIASSSPGVYTVTYAFAGSGGCSSYNTSATDTIMTDTWTGATSTDWTDGTNWVCGSSPASNFNVRVLNGVPYYPAFPATGAIDTINSLELDGSATINIDSAQGYNTFRINGTVTGSGSLIGSSTASLLLASPTTGTVNFVNYGGYGQELNNLTLLDNAVATLGTPLNIVGADTLDVYTGTLSIGNSSTLYTGGGLSLLSDNNSTAQVTSVGTGGSIIGNVTVQRYIRSSYNTPYTSAYNTNGDTIASGSPKRAWRLLTAPITNYGAGTPATIFNSWQAGAPSTYTPGIGTLITAPNATGASGNGLDGPSNYSLDSFNRVTQRLVSVDNTIDPTMGASISGSAGSADNNGYFIFIRGDRDPGTIGNPNYGDVAINNTILSATGSLQTGNQEFQLMPDALYQVSHTNRHGTIPVGADSAVFTLVGNPYASPVDLNMVTFVNPPTVSGLTDPTVYTWDPNLADVGGYVELDNLDGAGFSQGSVTGSAQDNNIQSSQAFFVQGGLGGGSSITFTESSKSTTNNNLVFRPATNLSYEYFNTNLYRLNPTDTALADGCVENYNNSYCACVDGLDKVKLTNINENLGIVRDGYLLSKERRPLIGLTDTVFLSLTGTAVPNYLFQFTDSLPVANHPGLEAFLMDSYTGDSTMLGLNGTTTVTFAITSDTASQRATRFMVVFETPGTVPVTYTSIKAWQQSGSNVAVQWAVNNQLNVKEYIVEKSTDGINFVQVGTVKSNGINGSSFTYNWMDENGVTGYNYYRIISVGNNGTEEYSKDVRVNIGAGAPPAIAVYPNPIEGGVVGLQFTNMPAGKYSVRMLDNIGQVIIDKEINHSGGSATETIRFSKNLAKGVYHLGIVGPANYQDDIKVVY